MRNCCTAVFQSSCIIFHPHQQCTRAPISLHPRQQLLFSSFLIIAILLGVVICISLMISGVEHLFLYLLTICVSSLEKGLFKSFTHLEVVFLLLLSCRSSLYILDINPLSDIFSPFVGCLFTLIVSCDAQKF